MSKDFKTTCTLTYWVLSNDKKLGGSWSTVIWEMSTHQTKEAAYHVIFGSTHFSKGEVQTKTSISMDFRTSLMHACMHAFLWDISKMYPAGTILMSFWCIHTWC